MTARERRVPTNAPAGTAVWIDAGTGNMHPGQTLERPFMERGKWVVIMAGPSGHFDIERLTLRAAIEVQS